MFDTMVTPATPERVFTLCKIVENNPMSDAEIRSRMEPAYLKETTGSSTIYFGDYRKAAEELGLVTNSDNMISLAVDPGVIATPQSMRRYINTRLTQFENGEFYKVTKHYFSLGSDVLTLGNNISNLNNLFSDQIGISLSAPKMRAWRFWASFLGFGYLHGMIFLPNCAEYLKDILSANPMEKRVPHSFHDFISWYNPQLRITQFDLGTHTLSYGLSNGLRTLHDEGYIRLEHILDQEDIWQLFHNNSHKIESTVTNITLLDKEA